MTPSRAKYSTSRPRVIPGHIAALDGLRAFAIVAVIFHHGGGYFLVQNSPPTSALREVVETLGVGVDLFFALSGFLITGILLDSLERPYYFKRFYWRRGLRIWPLYYAFLLGAYLVHRRVFSGIGFMPFALYYRNFLGPDNTSDIYIGQFWSLCVEEQFYLIWPVVIYFVTRRLRMPLIVSLMAAAFFIRIFLLSRGESMYVVYRLPFCHMDALLAGAAVAVLVRNNIGSAALRRISWAALACGLAGLSLVLSNQLPAGLAAEAFSTSLSSTSLIFGGVVGLCSSSRNALASSILGASMLREISKRSYGMYVFHLVPLYVSFKFLAQRRLLPLHTLPALLLILTVGLAAYGMAWVSWQYLESPILRLKNWEWFVRQAPAPVRAIE